MRRVRKGPFVKFSQKWAEKKHGERIKELLRQVITLARAKGVCSTLLIKVFFYRNPAYAHIIRGHYRDMYRHGFYKKEWEEVAGVCDSIITLKVGEGVSNEDIVETFAHELDHHMRAWWGRRLGEKRAEKFAQRILKKWRRRRQGE